MSPVIEKTLQEALELPEDARVDLATAILDSVDHEPADPGAEEAWRKEAKRRLEEIRSGVVKPIPWEQARSMIFDPNCLVVAVAHAKRKPGYWRGRVER